MYNLQVIKVHIYRAFVAAINVNKAIFVYRDVLQLFDVFFYLTVVTYYTHSIINRFKLLIKKNCINKIHYSKVLFRESRTKAGACKFYQFHSIPNSFSKRLSIFRIFSTSLIFLSMSGCKYV